MIDKVIKDQQDAAAKVRSGRKKPMGFLVGQIMQASGGRANPKIVRELLEKKLQAN